MGTDYIKQRPSGQASSARTPVPPRGNFWRHFDRRGTSRGPPIESEKTAILRVKRPIQRRLLLGAKLAPTAFCSVVPSHPRFRRTVMSSKGIYRSAGVVEAAA